MVTIYGPCITTILSLQMNKLRPREIKQPCASDLGRAPFDLKNVDTFHPFLLVPFSEEAKDPGKLPEQVSNLQADMRWSPALVATIQESPVWKTLGGWL